MKRELVLGGPGTGKTHEAVAAVGAAITAGVHPSQIAFVSFTRQAAEEARSRVASARGFDDGDLPHFRTIHSLCFQELGLRRGDVLSERHLQELGDKIGEKFTGRLSSDDGPMLSGAGRDEGDQLAFVEQYARSTCQSLEEAWREHGETLDWFRLKRFADAYRTFKQQRALLDFTDMLERYLAEGPPPLPVRLAIVDEAQDLTRLQWRVIERAFSSVDSLLVCGDDDQAVHRWAGAAVADFLALPFPRRIIAKSKRLPRRIFDVATGVVERVRNRFAKEREAADRDGAVEWVRDPEEVDLGAGTWLVLARTQHQVQELSKVIRRQGVVFERRGRSSVDPGHVFAMRSYEQMRAGENVMGDGAAAVLSAQEVSGAPAEARSYSAADLTREYGARFDAPWHDALIGIPVDDREYYLACRRRGEKLLAAPRVRLSTLHGAKGLQAEHVLLLTDLTQRVQRGMDLDADGEHRVFYTGVTRASEELVIVEPRGMFGYAI